MRYVRHHHENQLEINKDDCTKCWKIIKEVIGNSAGLKDQSSSIKVNGSVIKDRQLICNEFNNYCNTNYSTAHRRCPRASSARRLAHRL